MVKVRNCKNGEGNIEKENEAMQSSTDEPEVQFTLQMNCKSKHFSSG